MAATITLFNDDVSSSGPSAAMGLSNAQRVCHPRRNDVHLGFRASDYQADSGRFNSNSNLNVELSTRRICSCHRPDSHETSAESYQASRERLVACASVRHNYVLLVPDAQFLSASEDTSVDELDTGCD